VVCWGSGRPRREFRHADDLASACLIIMDRYSGEEIVNVGCGADVEIAELAGAVAAAVGFQGTITWDTSKPDGTFQKLLDVSKLNALGWAPAVELERGIAETVAWFRQHCREGEVRL